MLHMTMPRAALSAIQRLREDLEDALVQADALDLTLVAIKIAEALADLDPLENGSAERFC
jgi:hypothetical protein